MEFAICFKGFVAPDRARYLVRQAEAGGFTYCWFYDSHILWRESFVAMHQCAWAELSAVAPKVLDLAARAVATDDATISPFALAGTEAPPDLRLAVARHYAQRCVARMASVRDRLAFSHPVSSAARLRVGYVSPDFRHHSVAVSFRPLLEAHDRSAFEWTGYWIGQEPHDDETDRFAAGFDRFHVDLPAAG